MDRFFETQDLYLSAAILTILKIEPSYRVKNLRTIFCFPISDDLYKAMAAFNSGTLVDIFEYAENIRRLRSEMLKRRNQKGAA